MVAKCRWRARSRRRLMALDERKLWDLHLTGPDAIRETVLENVATDRSAKSKLQSLPREELDLPTTVPLVSQNPNAEPLRGDVLANKTNPDTVLVAAFTALGLLLTNELAVFFSLARKAAAHVWTVT
jgi:hypothetical protein